MHKWNTSAWKIYLGFSSSKDGGQEWKALLTISWKRADLRIFYNEMTDNTPADWDLILQNDFNPNSFQIRGKTKRYEDFSEA